jgi:hypothetical protein
MSRSWSNNIRMRNIPEELHEKAADGLFLATEHVLQVSNESVPLEEGTLERSGVASVDREKLRGAISYDTPYAVRQHEDLDAQHDSGRTAKYLENAMNSERRTIRQLIADAMRG